MSLSSRLCVLSIIFYCHLSSAPAWAEPVSVNAVVPVEVVEVAGGYQLQRDGQPYQIKGAGMASGAIESFAAHGGNSLRTWSTDIQGMNSIEFLDEAHSNGVTVALCLELGRERLGFDYDDEAAVARQLDYARGEVLKYKDHPALLFWIVGNELNHGFKNPRVFDAINAIARMIHEVDGNHPATTALAGFGPDLLELLEQRAPDLDFASFQLYGALDSLPEQVKAAAYTKPFMITEWGSTGHWEVAKTAWGAPIEMNSSEKARQFLARYDSVIAPNRHQIIGSYVFFWGQKQERTPTWYGMLLEDGSKTEAMEVMHKIWTGKWPEQRSPRVNGLLLDAKSAEQSVVLTAGKHYDASIDVTDPDQGGLSYDWQIMRESEAMEEGGDAEQVPETLAGLVEVREGGEIRLLAPAIPGAYRLFAHVYGDNGLAGHANLPFMVTSLRP